ncbi:MAG: glycosyltransferase [Dehalococcoidia bacterium]|jgi:glycosyltransferase involved in cell wall biosynthesis
MPKVSIVIPSYNHEKYIGECIQSALNQTFQDFEVIITDDGSSDRSVKIIKEFSDPRIQLYAFDKNRGACTAVNNCISRSRGEYIAVLNSDDAWEPGKLDKQVEYLDTHPGVGAVFTRVAFVDESGKQIGPYKYRFYHIFDKENRSRYEWLNYFFSVGNCLCHPSLLIRRECYDRVGLYDERMASLPDLDMWVRLCLEYDLHIIPEKLVRFRLREDEVSASGFRLPNIIRGYFEYTQILNHYLDIKDKQVLQSIFPEAGKYGPLQNEYIPYFLGRLALSVDHNSRQLWGLSLLFGMMKDPLIAKKLEETYGFAFLDLQELSANYDVFNLSKFYSVHVQSEPFWPAEQRRLAKYILAADRQLIKMAQKIMKG